ncbi:MAG: flippase-like domain-containing protein, partial [Bacteroidia bacterium]|nr:flippase-like domain-containing protein [Bacteroidia bacterium]
MPSALKTGLKILLFVGLGIGLIWLVLRNLTPKDIDEIKNAFSRVNYGVVVLSILIGILSHIFRALRWNQLMEPIGVKPSLQNTFLAVAAGYLANLAVPRLGEFTRCALLNRYNKAPLEATFGTVITERIIDSLTMLLFLIIVLTTQFKLYSTYLLKFIQPIVKKYPLIANPFLYIAVILIMVILFFIWRLFKSKKEKVVSSSKLSQIITKFLGGMYSVTKVKNKPLLLVYSISIWLFYLATSYVNFWALPETGNLGIGAALAMLVWGTFGFIFTQGGIGAYQIIAMQVFALYGINENIGFALGWIIWTAQTVIIIILGTLAFVLFPILNKQLSENN